MRFVPVPTHLPTVTSSTDLSSKMPPVLDQESIGSCAANACSNALRFCLGREGIAEFQPSRLFIYYQTRRVMGVPLDEDTGCGLREVCRAVARYHVCPESLWPYDPSPETRFKLPPDAAACAAAAAHRRLTYLSVAPDPVHIQACLREGHPVMIGITLYESFESQQVACDGMVPIPHKDSEQTLGGHAVLLVGMDPVARRYKVMNSWGAGWGSEGYFFLPFDYLADPTLCQGGMWTFRAFA